MISVLIPSLGGEITRFGWAPLARHILDMDVSVDYEIIICSPLKLELNHPKIKVISDPEGNVGSIIPVNECFRVSQGDYFICAPADFRIHPNCFNIQSFIESEVFASRKYKITTTGWATHPLVGETAHKCTRILGNKYIDHWLSTTTGIAGLSRDDIRILCMPAGARSTVEDLMDGLIFNETFKHVGADNFLSAYLASKEDRQQLPIYMPDTLCDFSLCSAAQNHLRERDKRVYFELMRYYMQNPEMPYNHVLEVEEDC